MPRRHSAGREREPALVGEADTPCRGDFDARKKGRIHARCAEGLTRGDVFATFRGKRRGCCGITTATAHGG